MGKHQTKRFLAILLVIILAMASTGCQKTPEPEKPAVKATPQNDIQVAVNDTEEEVFLYSKNSEGIYVDENGKTVDLGGMHILIRDWWSAGRKDSDLSEYERAQYAYWDEIQRMLR